MDIDSELNQNIYSQKEHCRPSISTKLIHKDQVENLSVLADNNLNSHNNDNLKTNPNEGDVSLEANHGEIFK